MEVPKLLDFFSRSFFTFYEEIETSNEIKILLNLMSDAPLNEFGIKLLYGILFEKARKENKIVIAEHDQINSNNLSLGLLEEIKPDKFILISTSTDPNFVLLGREDIHSGKRGFFLFLKPRIWMKKLKNWSSKNI
jgi:hypothetical protein